MRLYGVRNALYNAGYLFNHLIFTRSYRWYRLTKALSAPLLGIPYFVATPFDPGRHLGSIQAFRHSANSYARTLVSWPPSAAIHSHVHWIWGLTDTIESGTVPVVLIRNPRDVLLSTVRRPRGGPDTSPFGLMPWVCLIAWYRYYLRVLRHLDRVCLVDFDKLTCPGCYDGVKADIEERAGLKLISRPDFAPVNPSVASVSPDRLSLLTRILLSECARLHARLLKRARKSALGVPQSEGERSSECSGIALTTHRCVALGNR